MEKKLINFKNNILRSPYGPVKKRDQWKIRNNLELGELFTEADRVGEVKTRRLRWAGHASRKEGNSLLKIVMSGRKTGRRAPKRLKLRWINYVQIYVRMVGADEEIMQDRQRC